MKRTICVLIGVVLILSFVFPVMGAGLTVVFTSDSKAEPGSNLTVDKGAMLDHASNSSETYNAMLDGTVVYRWYKDGKPVQEGKKKHSYKVTEADLGSIIYVEILYYGDLDLTVEYGSVKSEVFTVTDPNAAPAPSITTKTLPEAVVGKAYAVKLECTDGDAVFSEVMGSQLYEFGLTLTQHGKIEGTPTKAGNCHINVSVTGEGGEDTMSYDLTVAEVPPETTAPIETTAPVTSTDDPPADHKLELTWWSVLLIVIASVGLGVGVAVMLVNKKSK